MSNEFYIKLGKDICKQIQNIREYAIEYNQFQQGALFPRNQRRML